MFAHGLCCWVIHVDGRNDMKKSDLGAAFHCHLHGDMFRMTSYQVRQCRSKSFLKEVLPQAHKDRLFDFFHQMTNGAPVIKRRKCGHPRVRSR